MGRRRPFESTITKEETLFPNSVFYFRPRNEVLDLHSIEKIDLDRIVNDNDVFALQEHLPNLLFSDVSAFQNEDPLFLKLFQLSQMTAEYLLTSQESLVEHSKALDADTAKLKEEVNKMQLTFDSQDEEIQELENEISSQQGTIASYEVLLLTQHKKKDSAVAAMVVDSTTTTIKDCPECECSFKNQSLLEGHQKKIHEQKLLTINVTSSDTNNYSLVMSKTSTVSQLYHDILLKENAATEDGILLSLDDKILGSSSDLELGAFNLSCLNVRVLYNYCKEQKEENTKEEGSSVISELTTAFQKSLEVQGELQSKLSQSSVENEKLKLDCQKLSLEMDAKLTALQQQLLNQMAKQNEESLKTLQDTVCAIRAETRANTQPVPTLNHAEVEPVSTSPKESKTVSSTIHVEAKKKSDSIDNITAESGKEQQAITTTVLSVVTKPSHTYGGFVSDEDDKDGKGDAAANEYKLILENERLRWKKKKKKLQQKLERAQNQKMIMSPTNLASPTLADLVFSQASRYGIDYDFNNASSCSYEEDQASVESKIDTLIPVMPIAVLPNTKEVITVKTFNADVQKEVSNTDFSEATRKASTTTTQDISTESISKEDIIEVEDLAEEDISEKDIEKQEIAEQDFTEEDIAVEENKDLVEEENNMTEITMADEKDTVEEGLDEEENITYQGSMKEEGGGIIEESTDDEKEEYIEQGIVEEQDEKLRSIVKIQAATRGFLARKGENQETEEVLSQEADDTSLILSSDFDTEVEELSDDGDLGLSIVYEEEEEDVSALVEDIKEEENDLEEPKIEELSGEETSQERPLEEMPSQEEEPSVDNKVPSTANIEAELSSEEGSGKEESVIEQNSSASVKDFEVIKKEEENSAPLEDQAENTEKVQHFVEDLLSEMSDGDESEDEETGRSSKLQQSFQELMGELSEDDELSESSEPDATSSNYDDKPRTSHRRNIGESSDEEYYSEDFSVSPQKTR